MTDATFLFVVWALVLGVVTAASLPLGSLMGLHVRFPPRHIAILAAFAASVRPEANCSWFIESLRRNPDSKTQIKAHIIIDMQLGTNTPIFQTYTKASRWGSVCV